ncbi:cytochrome P450 6A1-like isoform X2 [Neodiprion fabricii]|uniref:cytochrome P450 6A1-like isoform X2 n=1 Tax=Neodiprion fabricii TaxID=2872261 RepID=UPI001ED8EF54|nr:cytochrome P450 6A1-like isoform X2 [Neodiprion fabricii]
MLIQRQFTYWERKGLPYVKSESYLGTYADIIKSKKSVAELQRELYSRLKAERFGGICELLSPRLFIADPDLLRDIMTKNFDSWTSRGMEINPDVDPLSQHVVMLEGKKWKGVRATLTPTFTSARLKHMHYLLLECAKDLEKYLDSLARRNEPFESREVSAKFTTDVIGSCVFGIQMNSLGDEDAAFRKMGRKIVEATFRSRIALLIQGSSPWLFKKLKLSLTPLAVEEFFIKITKQAFDYREKNNVQRHDFIDLLRKLRNVDQPHGEDEIVFDDGLLTAQAFVFFWASFERSSTSIGYALHELAVKQDIQDRLREELREIKAANNGELTWDGLQKTLRKYPPIPQVG